MAVNAHKLDLLWNRVEDARQKWESANRSIQEIGQVSGEMSSADGNYAYGQALKEQSSAVKNYLHALEKFKSALYGHAEPLAKAVSGKGITPREQEVLKLIASGKSSRHIAAQLGIAFKTVVAHRCHLHQKLKAHKSVDLIRVAIRMGLIKS